MPLHEFRCRCCGERFEQLIRGSADDDRDKSVVCPRCRATEVERLFSAFARASGPRCDPLPSGAG